MRPAIVKYYVDADILGLAHVLVTVRGDEVTYPGDPGGTFHKRERCPCPISDPGTPDTVWVPEVATREWLIISRDHNIAENVAELQAVRDSGARMVALAGEDAGNTWGQLEVVMRRWRQIEELREQAGPFIYRASRTVWRPVDLKGPSKRQVRTSPRTPRRRPSTGAAPDGLWPPDAP